MVVTDKDVPGVRVTSVPRIPVRGEVVWDGEPPKLPPPGNLTLSLRSMTRTIYESAQTPIPGQFSFEGLILDDYAVDLRGLPGNLYVKEFLYGNDSVLHKSIRIGSGLPDAGPRIVLGQDGAYIIARVADKDGNPVGNATVIVFPQSSASEAALAGAMETGQTDQNGIWKSVATRPGKYYVLAGLAAVDHTPETIDKLWRSRNRAREVGLSPGGSAQVTLEPTGIE